MYENLYLVLKLVGNGSFGGGFEIERVFGTAQLAHQFVKGMGGGYIVLKVQAKPLPPGQEE